MQVKSIVEFPLGAFCNTSDLHYATFAIKIFVLSISVWPFYGFKVCDLKRMDPDKEIF